MADGPPRYRHIKIDGFASTGPYTYPKEGRGPTLDLPVRDRRQHSARLLAEIELARERLTELRARRAVTGVGGKRGIYLEFESSPGFELALQSLDRETDKIELLASRHDGTMIATVHVPEGKLAKLVSLVEKYRDEDDQRWGKPRNKRLVESIAQIRQAALAAFWTDDLTLLPQPGDAIWWEVWLRAGHDRVAVYTDFSRNARSQGIQVGEQKLEFPDRTVLLVYATYEQMSASVALLDCIAELRRAKDPPSFFTALSPREQGDWVRSTLERVQHASGERPAVCILDTGVNRQHPLLSSSLAENGCLACRDEWGVHDHHGHGTEMAGLALYGDLTNILGNTGAVRLETELESVKVLPPPGHPRNEPDLYGAMIQQAVARAEIAHPTRLRSLCMAVTAPDSRDRGQPSSWSAELDVLCSGAEDDQRRLMLISAGNVDEHFWRHYPDYNEIAQVLDPAQAWNALTVGAYTERTMINAQEYPGWTPVAQPGTLSPSSSTSVTWQSQWPNKPDIVLEGGNAARNPATGEAAPLDDLTLLTTDSQITRRLLVPTWATSAATAQAARLGAILMARYPSFWPETIRALLVHSARWTDAMRSEFAAMTPARRREVLLRRYGYGVPDIERASWSASNRLTLIAEERLQPYGEPRGTHVPTKDLQLYELPWPKEQLQALPSATQVTLRVTLSYFIEPNPARRGWKYKHRYQSHGLRFAMQNALEPLDVFRSRISKDLQDADGESPNFSEPGWKIGADRNRGSIHSDWWTGSAADLAQREHLCVFPVGGWWKERRNLRRWSQSVRYSLIVSIETPITGVDIYTPVAARIGVLTTIAT